MLQFGITRSRKMGRGGYFHGVPKILWHRSKSTTFVHLCVSCEISRTGGRSATLLSPTWRASPGELHRLLRELMRRVVREKNPLELFRRKRVKPRLSRYNGAILVERGEADGSDHDFCETDGG